MGFTVVPRAARRPLTAEEAAASWRKAGDGWVEPNHRVFTRKRGELQELQESVFEILRLAGRPLTTRELGQELEISPELLYERLRSMARRTHGEAVYLFRVDKLRLLRGETGDDAVPTNKVRWQLVEK